MDMTIVTRERWENVAQKTARNPTENMQRAKSTTPTWVVSLGSNSVLATVRRALPWAAAAPPSFRKLNFMAPLLSYELPIELPLPELLQPSLHQREDVLSGHAQFPALLDERVGERFRLVVRSILALQVRIAHEGAASAP